MMFPMRAGVGYRQPFRFTGMGTEELHAIDREVTALLKQALKRPEDRNPRPPRYSLEIW